MREGHRANALLVELLLVILFFMLGATTLVELFADARHKSLQARATNTAIMEAENIADDLYGAEEPINVLARLGFTKDNETWILEKDEYTLTVTGEEEATETGVLRKYTISATGDGKDLFSLPSTRFLPKEVSP
jgi:hypothetical protein